METQNNSFSDLPHDVLSNISDSERFGLIDFLSFRGTCKNTRFASSDSSAAIEEQSSSHCYPWFLIYGDGPNCSILNNTNNRLYKINLPEIANSTCVFSLDGWLLFLSTDSSMFFFCPFSKSRIDLPNCPFSLNDSNFAAAFSHSPTNRDCAVVVVRRSKKYIQTCLLRRGDNEWRKDAYNNNVKHLGAITSVIHHEGAFHFLDRSSHVGSFYDKIKAWSSRFTSTVKNRDEVDKNEVVYIRENDFFGKKSHEMMLILGMEESCCISICGTLISRRGFEYHFIDHEKYIDISFGIETGNNGRRLLRQVKGVWIQPRFHQIPPNQSW